MCVRGGCLLKEKCIKNVKIIFIMQLVYEPFLVALKNHIACRDSYIYISLSISIDR